MVLGHPLPRVPKDGLRAGVTMATSLVCALLQVPVRRDLAMTRKLTLRD